MDHFYPSDLLVVGTMAALAFVGAILYDRRHVLRRFVAFVVDRYVAMSTSEPNEPVQADVRRENANERGSEVRSFGQNPADSVAMLTLNAEEVEALTRMIEHKIRAAKPTKSSTIQAGFGVSRGDSPRYRRASLIYDTLFAPPVPAQPAYRPLDAQRRPVLTDEPVETA